MDLAGSKTGSFGANSIARFVLVDLQYEPEYSFLKFAKVLDVSQIERAVQIVHDMLMSLPLVKLNGGKLFSAGAVKKI